MSNPLSTVAVAGATGNLGKHVVEALLTQFRPRFSAIILLTRKASPQTDEWKSRGATIVQYDEPNLPKSLEGVDVLINTVGSSGKAFKDALVRSLKETKVSVYFPSEFGADHYSYPVPHPEWDPKKRHFELASSLAPEMKIVRVVVGLFLEDSIGPWFGFDTVRGVYEAVGSADQEVSYNSYEDVGRSVAVLAGMGRDAPDFVRLGGSSFSIMGTAEVMRKAGGGEIEVKITGLEEYKSWAEATESETPENYLRFMMGEGRLKHISKDRGGLGCDNELVNPGESLWKWRTIADLAKESKGKPWADATWTPS
ncbi:MAG: hypothetical protein M1814_004785 [Vezdaea aestivalis]|nr:MAG: hypothetical protein M1814_004785 [Vezdaea aestivalis]